MLPVEELTFYYPIRTILNKLIDHRHYRELIHEVNKDKKSIFPRFRTNHLFIEKIENGEKLPYYLWGKYKKYLYHIPSELAKIVINKIYEIEKEVEQNTNIFPLNLLGIHFDKIPNRLTQRELDRILEQAVREFASG